MGSQDAILKKQKLDCSTPPDAAGDTPRVEERADCTDAGQTGSNKPSNINDQITPKKTRRTNIELDELKYEPAELCFVTAVNRPTRTFFVQLCKFSNDDLNSFNSIVNTYSLEKHQKLITEASSSNDKKRFKKIHSGYVVCAMYKRDNAWYRAIVLRKDEEKLLYHVVFVDYGNVEVVTLDQIILPDAEELPIIKRCPFGLTCFMKGAESFDEERGYHLIKCAYENYMMIHVLERQSFLQYLVEIPQNAYNLPFWVNFEPKRFSLKSTTNSSGMLEASIDCQ